MSNKCINLFYVPFGYPTTIHCFAEISGGVSTHWLVPPSSKEKTRVNLKTCQLSSLLLQPFPLGLGYYSLHLVFLTLTLRNFIEMGGIQVSPNRGRSPLLQTLCFLISFQRWVRCQRDPFHPLTSLKWLKLLHRLVLRFLFIYLFFTVFLFCIGLLIWVIFSILRFGYTFLLFLLLLRVFSRLPMRIEEERKSW